MFAWAYPELNPSYAEYPEKFQGLWKGAIREQADVAAHRKDYVACYYGKDNQKAVAQCLSQYAGHAVKYGENPKYG